MEIWDTSSYSPGFWPVCPNFVPESSVWSNVVSGICTICGMLFFINSHVLENLKPGLKVIVTVIVTALPVESSIITDSLLFII